MIREIRSFYLLTKTIEAANVESEVPEAYLHVFKKKYPRFKKYAFQIQEMPGKLSDALERRESKRNFSGASLHVDVVGTLLNTMRIVDPKREPERRSYPSGGARFPIEAYLIAFNVEGLPAGVYHYGIEDKALYLLFETDLRHQEQLFVSDFVNNASASIVFTSVISRAEVKYKHQAYPDSLLEAGHIAQNMLLATTMLDVDACPIIGFVNDHVADILDLTDDELPIYTLALGKV